MAEELVKLIEDDSGFSPDRDRMLPTCLQLGIKAYVQIPENLTVVSRGIAVDPERGLAPEPGGMPALIGHPECRYISVEQSQLVRLVSIGAIKCTDFRSELLLATSDGLLRRLPLISYLVRKSAMQAFETLGTTSFASEGSEVDSWDQIFFQTDGVQEGIEELSHPQEVTIYIKDLYLFPCDAERVREQVATSAATEDPWGHRRNAPAVALVYRAAKHFSQSEYSFSAVDRWIREHDIYGVFQGKSKSREYAARLINRTPKIGSVESDDLLDVEKIQANELGRDYRDPVCSKRLSLLLLATDVWLEELGDPARTMLPKDGLEGYLYELGFNKGDETALKKKREDARRPALSRSAVGKENQCAYLEATITAKAHYLGVVAAPQNAAH